MKEKYEESMLYYANPQYLLREIAGDFILVPVGQAAVDFNGLAAMNQTSVWLWHYLQSEKTAEDIIRAFADEYDLSPEQSEEDVNDFLKLALEHGLILKHVKG